MKLSDKDIIKCLECGLIEINPLNQESQIQPASVDLRLGKGLKAISHMQFPNGQWGNAPIYPSKKVEYEDKQFMVVNPGEFVLGTTIEYIKIPSGLGATVEGRSSVGRQGLFVENAGWIDPGFEGQITLEFFNATKNPWHLEEGMRICQITFETLTSCATPYNGKYQGQKGTTGGALYKDRIIYKN